MGRHEPEGHPEVPAEYTGVMQKAMTASAGKDRNSEMEYDR